MDISAYFNMLIQLFTRSIAVFSKSVVFVFAEIMQIIRLCFFTRLIYSVLSVILD